MNPPPTQLQSQQSVSSTPYRTQNSYRESTTATANKSSVSSLNPALNPLKSQTRTAHKESIKTVSPKANLYTSVTVTVALDEYAENLKQNKKLTQTYLARRLNSVATLKQKLIKAMSSKVEVIALEGVLNQDIRALQRVIRKAAPNVRYIETDSAFLHLPLEETQSMRTEYKSDKEASAFAEQIKEKLDEHVAVLEKDDQLNKECFPEQDESIRTLRRNLTIALLDARFEKLEQISLPGVLPQDVLMLRNAIKDVAPTVEHVEVEYSFVVDREQQQTQRKADLPRNGYVNSQPSIQSQPSQSRNRSSSMHLNVCEEKQRKSFFKNWMKKLKQRMQPQIFSVDLQHSPTRGAITLISPLVQYKLKSAYDHISYYTRRFTPMQSKRKAINESD